MRFVCIDDPKIRFRLKVATTDKQTNMSVAASTSNAEEKSIVQLQSSEEEIIEVSKDVICIAETVQNMLDDLGGSIDSPVPLPNVTAPILRNVLVFCQHYHDNPPAPKSEEQKEEFRLDDFDEWETKYLDVDQETLFGTVLAANYMSITPLMDLICRKIASDIKGLTTEQIREKYGIVNDFTPEEEEQVRKENEWCEER